MSGPLVGKLKNFKQELTCCICNELFDEPKTMACLHTFCQKCLADHIAKRRLNDDPAAEDSREKVPCPLCASVQVLEEPDIKHVTTNHSYKNMVAHLSLEERVRTGCNSGPSGAVTPHKCEMCQQTPSPVAISFCKTCNAHQCKGCRDYHKMAKFFSSHEMTNLEDLSSSSSGNADAEIVTHYTWKCDIHAKNGDQLNKLTDVSIYCKDCDKLICKQCALVEPHGNHIKYEARDIIDNANYKPAIQTCEQEVKQVEETFTQFIAEMKELKKGLDDNQKKAKEEIEKKQKAIQKELEKENKKLMANVDKIFNEKSRRLEQQVNELQKIEKTLSDSRKMVNDTLTVGIPEEILFLMTQMRERMKYLCTKYEDYPRTPNENNILKFEENGDFSMLGAIGIVSADPFPPAYTADDLGSAHFIKGKELTFTVTCRDIAGTPRPTRHDIIVNMSPLPQGTASEGVVKEKNEQKGTYKVALKPHVSGDHKIDIFVVAPNEEMIPIKESPFEVIVSPSLVTEFRAENVRLPQLQNPWGIAVNDAGKVVISDIGANKIVACNYNDFTNVQWIGCEGSGKVQFKSPRGLAFTIDGDIAVVEKQNHRVQVVSLEGEHKFTFGKKGLGNGEFEGPTDVAIDSDGIIFVSDSNNHRIQYFKPNGEFIGFYGAWGPLNTPYAIAIDPIGRILITEQKAHRIQGLKLKENAQDECSSSACTAMELEPVFSSPSTNSEPVGIAFHPPTNYIVVTDLKQHKILIYNKNGVYLSSLGREGVRDNELSSPMGISVLPDSRLIVCDCDKRKIMIFSIV